MARDRSSRDRSGTTAADSWLRRRPMSVDIALAAGLAATALPTTVRLIWISDSQVEGRLAITAVVLLAHVSVALRRIRIPDRGGRRVSTSKRPDLA